MPDSTSRKQKVISIVGPTGSRKTRLSIELAKKYNGEIISADSRQIYRGMDLGTAKATLEEQKLAIHHLIDIKDPNEAYAVTDFKRDAEAAIRAIAEKGKLPMLVGGTGLYIWAVLDNLDIPEIKADLALRTRIENDIQTKGLKEVFAELVKLDPEAAYIVDPNNPRRVIRALEVAIITGKPFTGQRKKKESPYDAFKIGINPPPDVLRARIDRRIDAMASDGLFAEVKHLVDHYGKDCQAFDAIGYREIIGCLEGKTTLEKAFETMKLDTWHYAKRQITWFKRDKEIHWFEDSAVAETGLADMLPLWLRKNSE